MYQVLLFRLASDDLVQRPVLVEEKVRVSVSQHSCALGGQHEELVATVWYKERPASVVTAFIEMAGGIDLLLSSVVIFSWYVFVSVRTKLVGRMVAYCRQCFDDGFRRGRFRW